MNDNKISFLRLGRLFTKPTLGSNHKKLGSSDIFGSILFYSGTYAVEGDVITHKVTEASNPQRIGKDMIRYAKTEGTRVTLSSPKESFGTAHLVWQRIS